MVRTLLIIAAASLVLMLVSFAGAAALGGPGLLRNGWEINVDDWSRNSTSDVAGPTIERTLDWSATDTLTVDLPADVTFTQGDETSVVVSGPQGLVERVRLADGHLTFEDEGAHSRSITFGSRNQLTVTITAPDVNRFVMEGAGDLILNNLDRDALEIRLTGAGDVEAHGQTGSLDLAMEGVGNADLADLVAQTAEVRSDGVGNSTVHAVESANIVLSGIGDVDLVQRPAHLTQDVSGIGSVDVAPE